MQLSLKQLFIGTTVLAILIVMHRCLLDSITLSKQDLTHTSISLIRTAVKNYVSESGRIPQKLEEIEEFLLKDGTNDAWGRRINFKVEQNIISIESLGRDGVPGGLGDDRDILTTIEF